jgi:hypothetical protein
MDLPEDTFPDPEKEKQPDLPEHRWFYFKHGRKASNIAELKSALENMNDTEFRHHVNNDKNDFASWVQDVFGEEKLARNMREVSDREGIIILLDEFLDQGNEPPPPPAHVVHHRHSKKIIIPEEKTLSAEPEKELSEKEIKEIVNDAMQVFDKPGSEKGEEAKEEVKEEAKEEHGEQEEKEEEAEKEEPQEEYVALEEPVKDEGEWEPKQMLEPEIEKPRVEKEPSKIQKEHHKFIVEEFIYGFILGLIFGLIMLGIILRINVT